MAKIELAPILLEHALDERGRLPTDPASSRAHQAQAVADLSPAATDALVLALFASAPPGPDAPPRPLASSWLALRDSLVAEQGLLEKPILA